MPEIYRDLWEAALNNPGHSLGLLAVLVLVGVWIDRR